MVKKPALVLAAVLLAWGCGDDDDGPGGGEGGSFGAASGRGGSGGRGGAGSGGTSGGRGGATSGGANSGGSGQAGAPTDGGAAGGGQGGQAGDDGGAAGAGGAGATAGGGGAAGADTAGAGGGPSAGTGGVAGGGPQGGSPGSGGAGGSGGSEDPACQEIDPEATLTSHLKFTADNECTVYVNGTSVGSSNSWGAAVTVDVSLFLHPGRQNVIAIIGTNTSSQANNDRGIIGELTVDTTSGTQALIWSDDDWRVASAESTGWTELGFDDSEWIFATEIAAQGDPPWGNVLPNSSAKWIWSGPVPADTANKPNLESTYARRVFYLALDGLTASNTPGCRPPAGSDG